MSCSDSSDDYSNDRMSSIAMDLDDKSELFDQSLLNVVLPAEDSQINNTNKTKSKG